MKINHQGPWTGVLHYTSCTGRKELLPIEVFPLPVSKRLDKKRKDVGLVLECTLGAGAFFKTHYPVTVFAHTIFSVLDSTVVISSKRWESPMIVELRDTLRFTLDVCFKY